MVRIKKSLLAILILIAMLFSVACASNLDDFDDNTGANGTDNNIDNEQNNDTNEGLNSDTSNDADKPNTSSSNDDLIEDTGKEDEEEIISSGNYTKDKTQVKERNDRHKQIDKSNADYNTGSLLTEDELESIKKKANVIVSTSIIFPNGAKAMKQYLTGNGETLKIDLKSFFQDEKALEYRNSDINEALRAAENIATNEPTTVYTIEEQVHHGLTGDWKNALGSYFVNIEIKNLKKSSIFGAECYSATIKYSVIDFYNWDTNDYNSSVPVIDLSPHELHELHKAGMAKEFLSYGEIEYKVTWAKGADAEIVLNEK